MAMSRIVGILVLLALALVYVSDMAEAKQVLPSTCERIFEYFTNCLGFLVGDSNCSRGIALRRCCQHVNKLNTLAHHRTGPRTICWCIQVMVKGMTPALVPSKIQGLPLVCNTTLSFPISDSMDCSK